MILTFKLQTVCVCVCVCVVSCDKKREEHDSCSYSDKLSDGSSLCCFWLESAGGKSSDIIAVCGYRKRIVSFEMETQLPVYSRVKYSCQSWCHTPIFTRKTEHLNKQQREKNYLNRLTASLKWFFLVWSISHLRSIQLCFWLIDLDILVQINWLFHILL